MADPNKTTGNWKVQPMNGWDPNLVVGLNQQIVGAWTRSISALASELSEFVQARLQEDFGAWRQLSACKDVTEAFECQSRFVQKAAADYLDEANKLSRLALSAAFESISEGGAQSREKTKAAA